MDGHSLDYPGLVIFLAHRFKLPGFGCGVCAKQALSNSFLNERERFLGVPCFYFSSLSPEHGVPCFCLSSLSPEFGCYQLAFLSFDA